MHKPTIRRKQREILPYVDATPIEFSVITNAELERRLAEVKKHTARVKISLPKGEAVSSEEWKKMQRLIVYAKREQKTLDMLRKIVKFLRTSLFKGG